MFGDEEFLAMFDDAYQAVMRHMRTGHVMLWPYAITLTLLQPMTFMSMSTWTAALW